MTLAPDPGVHDAERRLKADSRVLAMLLAATAVLEALPTGSGLAAFTEALLGDVPGIAAGAVELYEGESALGPGERAEPSSGRHGVWILPLLTDDRPYGEMRILVSDAQVLAPYEPFVANLATTLALILENRRQRDLLQSRLRESEERYRVLFDTMQEGCVLGHMVYDAAGAPMDWVHLAANPAFERMTNLEDLQGRSMAETYPELGSLSTGLLDVFGTVAATGLSDRLELEWPGCARWFDISVSSPERGFFVATFSDVTGRKAAEAELRQSQKMEALGRLAGGIAHDFNNLLTAIVGYSELLLADGRLVAAGLEADVLEIRRAADRANALTRQILAFSRRQALQPLVVSLNEVLAGMETLLCRTIGENVELTTWRDPGLWLTEVDPNQLEQVLINLAVNARDAMPDGGQLTIETANAEVDRELAYPGVDIAPGAYVVLSVSDTGVGIDACTLPHIFEPFFTTKGPDEGTGLGLSTVYGIVRQSGGQVVVHSRPGSGSTFEVFLPRARAEGSPVVSNPARMAFPAEERKSIVVVEDESALRQLVQRILEGAGYSVTAYSSADEAFEALRVGEVEVDLLLTDVVLPGALQGDHLARRFSSLFPDAPVLFMSGYTRDAIVHAGKLDEGVNYLAKPFTPEALLRRIREVLSGCMS